MEQSELVCPSCGYHPYNPYKKGIDYSALFNHFVRSHPKYWMQLWAIVSRVSRVN